jgi:multimeric flavodoxin WrbA
MKLLVLSGNPKQEGLCRSLEDAALGAAEAVGLDAALCRADAAERCHVCGDGWGVCRAEHRCAFGGDGFDGIQAQVRAAEAYVLLTPVYWGEMAEGLKCCLDRLRRCEFGADGALGGKPVLLVASAGGSGNGILSCLEQMERFCRHCGAEIFDMVGVNRWNQSYKRQALDGAVRALGQRIHA